MLGPFRLAQQDQIVLQVMRKLSTKTPSSQFKVVTPQHMISTSHQNGGENDPPKIHSEYHDHSLKFILSSLLRRPLPIRRLRLGREPHRAISRRTANRTRPRPNIRKTFSRAILLRSIQLVFSRTLGASGLVVEDGLVLFGSRSGWPDKLTIF